MECDDCASGKIQRPLCRHAPLRTARNRASDPGKEINLLPLLSSPPLSLPRGSVPIPTPEPALRRHALSSTLTCLLCRLAGCLLAGWLGGQMLSRSRPIRPQGDAGGAAALGPRARGNPPMGRPRYPPFSPHCKMCRVTLHCPARGERVNECLPESGGQNGGMAKRGRGGEI